MDTLTHIVLGACIGEAIAGKQLGRKALFLGAIAQSLPDIDVVASAWLPVTNDLLAHRGITHSFLFVVVVSPLLALLSRYVFRSAGMDLRKWTFFWGLQIFIHVFIDSFNAYGTGWFEPFSHYRVSFNTMFVADPLYTIWPAIAFVMLLVLRQGSPKRVHWVWIGLGMSTLYWALGITNKFVVDQVVKEDLNNKGIACSRYISTPTPLNNLLWYIMVPNDSGYYIGYRSVFDHKPTIDFRYTYRNDSLLKKMKKNEDLENLLQFSEGYYTAEYRHDTLVFNDLRFGEILGWCDANPRFVCHYFLQYPGANAMIVQRGRFAGWNKQELLRFLRRIGGE